MLELSREFKDTFKEVGYGAFAELTSIRGNAPETHLFAYVPTSEILLTMGVEDLKTTTSMELHYIDFPLIRFLTEIKNIANNPLKLEVFFNPLDHTDLEALRSLMHQKQILVHLYDDELKYALTVEIPWYSQKDAYEIWEKAKALSTGRKGENFFEARDRFIKDNPQM